MTLATVKEKMKKRQSKWGDVPPELLREMLINAAREIGERKEIDLPVGLIDAAELTRTKFNFLDGKTLDGMCQYFAKHRDGGDTMQEIFKRANIKPSLEDIITAKKLKRNIFWERFYGEPLSLLMGKIGEKCNRPPSLLVSQNFEQPMDFLDGSNLAGLYIHAIIKKDEKQSPLAYLREKAGIKTTKQDITAVIKKKQEILWRDIEGEALGEFLQDVALEIGRPLYLWRDHHFLIPIASLNNYRLSGLRDYIADNKDKQQTAIEYLYKRIGWELEPITFAYIEMCIENNTKILWKRVPPEVKREVLNKAAEERDLPASFLTYTDLKNPFIFLSGRTLKGLFEYSRGQERDENETPLMWIKKHTQIPIPEVNARNQYRIREIQRLFLKFFPEPKDENFLQEVANDHITLDSPFTLIWSKAITRIYQRFFHKKDIEPDSLQNEAMFAIGETIRSNPSATLREVIFSTNAYLEKYITTQMKDYYRKKSLAETIGDTDLKLQDTLKTPSLIKPTDTIIFSERMKIAFGHLSPFQRALIMGITLSEFTFEEMVDEIKSKFGMETDPDILQEHYEEALQIMSRHVDRPT
mgnify:FL=1